MIFTLRRTQRQAARVIPCDPGRPQPASVRLNTMLGALNVRESSRFTVIPVSPNGLERLSDPGNHSHAHVEVRYEYLQPPQLPLFRITVGCSQ